MTFWGLFFYKHSFCVQTHSVHSKDVVALLQNLCLLSKFASMWLANTTSEEPEATFFLIVYKEMSVISIYVKADELWRPFGTSFSWLPSPCLPFPFYLFSLQSTESAVQCWTIAVKSCHSLPPGRSASPCPPQTPSHLRSLAARGHRLGNGREGGKKVIRQSDREATETGQRDTTLIWQYKLKQMHTPTHKSDKPTKYITRLVLSLSLYLSPPISFSACQIIYISLSVFLKAKTQC